MQCEQARQEYVCLRSSPASLPLTRTRRRTWQLAARPLQRSTDDVRRHGGGSLLRAWQRRSIDGAAALVVAGAVVLAVSSSSGKERAMCADRLMGLTTCLTFVQDKATARAPTPH